MTRSHLLKTIIKSLKKPEQSISLIATGCEMDYGTLLALNDETFKFKKLDLSDNKLDDNFMQVILYQFHAQVTYAFGRRDQKVAAPLAGIATSEKDPLLLAVRAAPTDACLIKAWTKRGSMPIQESVLFLFLARSDTSWVDSVDFRLLHRLRAVCVSGSSSRSHAYLYRNEEVQDLGAIAKTADISKAIDISVSKMDPASSSTPWASAGAGYNSLNGPPTVDASDCCGACIIS
ncbi:MAG: hypothetical protein Q7V63_03740 [Gammaproteobacteria bacterium]|nr:hypothetical protein [Gammaproteobacteria bacterium]